MPDEEDHHDPDEKKREGSIEEFCAPCDRCPGEWNLRARLFKLRAAAGTEGCAGLVFRGAGGTSVGVVHRMTGKEKGRPLLPADGLHTYVKTG
jgi:hypothetical protein